MSRGERIAAAALRMVGTPFVPQGRVPGSALDCAGLVVCAARDAGLEVSDCAHYDVQQDQTATVIRLLRENGFWGAGDDLGDAMPGDIVLYWMRRQNYMHLSIFDGRQIIHAVESMGERPGQVVRQLPQGFWADRVHSVWRAPTEKEADA